MSSKYPAPQKTFDQRRIESYAEWRKSWPKAPVKQVTNPGPKMQALLSYIREHYMGVIFKQYQIGPLEHSHPGKLAVDEFHPFLHCYDLFNHPEVDESLRPDHVNDQNPEFIDPWDATKSLEMQSINDYIFIAELADFINAGSAYSPGYATGEQALQVAKDCYKELMGDNQFFKLDNLYHFYHLGHEWSSWFIDEWIDYAWVSFDYNSNIVSILMVTDTD